MNVLRARSRTFKKSFFFASQPFCLSPPPPYTNLHKHSLSTTHTQQTISPSLPLHILRTHSYLYTLFLSLYTHEHTLFTLSTSFCLCLLVLKSHTLSFSVLKQRQRDILTNTVIPLSFLTCTHTYTSTLSFFLYSLRKGDQFNKSTRYDRNQFLFLSSSHLTRHEWSNIQF